MFALGRRLRPEAPAIIYFESTLSFAEAEAEAEALATAFRDLGVLPGDRIALMLQNVPHFPIAVHAAWLCGAVVTPVNPMYKTRELEYQLRDAGVRVIVCLESLYDVVHRVRNSTFLTHVVAVSELDYLEEVPTTLASHARLDCPDALQWRELIAQHRGATPKAAEVRPDDVALITYTSGTTGTPKGALNLHSAVAYQSYTWQDCFSLDESDVTVAMAPMFHITGLLAHLMAARLTMTPLLLAYRFDAGELLRLIERWRGTYMIGPLTAFIALMSHPDFGRRDLTSLVKVASGGAAVSPTVVEKWERQLGGYIHNCYGLTETTTLVHWVPPGSRAPVDSESGALSIGLSVPGSEARIVSVDNGVEVNTGEVGELLVRGPMVVPGYWNMPEESAIGITDGWLHTGDVGKRDTAGWFYIIDRVKDLINVSGYKVWPREVEDVLYQHAGVQEACVVGVPDDYSGESVRAYVVPERAAAVTSEDLIAHCRSLMAVYKAPREVRIVSDLPRTATGKLMRRVLRDDARAEASSVGGS